MRGGGGAPPPVACAPLQHCRAPLPPHRRYAQVRLLTGQYLYFSVQLKARAKELQVQVTRHLSAMGMLDTDLFGLASATPDGEYVFLEPDAKLSKHAPKAWKTSHDHGLDSIGRPLLQLHFRVQFYVDSALLLREQVTRQHYYLQLKENVVAQEQAAPRETLLLLGALALQAERGDCADTHAAADGMSESMEEEEAASGVLPEWMLTQGPSSPSPAPALAALRRALRGLSRAQAQLRFILEASSPHAPHNLHLFRLRTRKSGATDAAVGVCAHGLHVYHERAGQPRVLAATFPWAHIGKLSFEKRKFEIRGAGPADGQRMCFFAASDSRARHLLALSRATHQKALALQPRLAELRRRHEEDERRRRHEGSAWAPQSTCEQRVSVISTASSNTTSGIVSDRVQGAEDSEDDLEAELATLSPLVTAAAVSLESLGAAPGRIPLATSVSPPVPPGVPLNETPSDSVVGTVGVSVDHHQHQATRSSTSRGPLRCSSAATATPPTPEGSQSSSRCSTIQATLSEAPMAYQVGEVPHQPHLRARSDGEARVAAVRTWLAGSCATDPLCTASAPPPPHQPPTLNTSLPAWVCRHCGCAQEVSPKHMAASMPTLDLSVQSATAHYPHQHHQRGAGTGAASTPVLTSGTYPNRATVSNTFDTDSDYVQVAPMPNQQPKEAPARLVTTKAHISVLTAHASRAPKASPCYATPTNKSTTEGRHQLSDPGQNSDPVYGVLVDSCGEAREEDHKSTAHRSWAPSLQTSPVSAPGPSVATVYTSQVSRGHIEQFRRQLLADVDYVVFPHKDPALSRQEYLEAHGLDQRPPYLGAKASSVYLSAPNVALPPPQSTPSGGQTSSSWSPQPPQQWVAPSPLSPYQATPSAPSPILRTRSDESVLGHGAGDDSMGADGGGGPGAAPLDLAILRAQSRALDLPLIAALCSDCSLLRQTSAFVLPHHPPTSATLTTPVTPTVSSTSGGGNSGSSSGSLSGNNSNNNKSLVLMGRAARQLFARKYPVSGLSTTQLNRRDSREVLRRPPAHPHGHLFVP